MYIPSVVHRIIWEINTKFGETELLRRSCLNSLDYHVKRINKKSRILGDCFRDKTSIVEQTNQFINQRQAT